MDKTSPKLFCFVLMPFSSDFDDIYKLGIKETCEVAGTYCERVDEQVYEGRITDRIYNQIAKADLIIADMSGKNANVFYEVGYAHALDKRTILLTQDADDIPFDLKHHPHIIYGKKIIKIKEELTKRLEWVLNNEESSGKSMKTDIEIYVNSENLSSGSVVLNITNFRSPGFNLVIYNNSPSALQSGDYQIGIISRDFHIPNDPGEMITTIRMPDKSYIHMLPSSERIFPRAYAKSSIVFYNSQESDLKLEFKFIVRVFSKTGFQDYTLKLKRDKRVVRNIL